ncbi:IPT/TIG domain-containing protein [Bacteroidota bacterium]
MKYVIAIIFSLFLLSLSCDDDQVTEPIVNKDSPVIERITPDNGSPGKYVSIIGKGFGENQDFVEIQFDNERAEIKLFSDTIIIVIIPQLAVGFHKINLLINDEVVKSPTDFEIVDPGVLNTIQFINFSPGKCSQGDTVQIKIRNYGVKYENISVQFDSFKTKILKFTDTLISVIVNQSLPNGKYNIIIRWDGFSVSSSKLIEITESRYSFNFISCHYLNFLVEVKEASSWYDPQYGSGNNVKFDTIVSGYKFNFETSKWNVYDFSSFDTIHYFQPITDFQNNISLIIDRSSQKLREIKFDHTLLLTYKSYERSYQLFQTEIESLDFIINNDNNYIADLKSQNISTLKYNFLFRIASSRNGGNDVASHSTTYKIIGLTDSSEIVVTLSPIK